MQKTNFFLLTGIAMVILGLMSILAHPIFKIGAIVGLPSILLSVGLSIVYTELRR